MQNARQNQYAVQAPGAFGKFVQAQKAQTPSVVRLINGLGDSTLFRKFDY